MISATKFTLSGLMPLPSNFNLNDVIAGDDVDPWFMIQNPSNSIPSTQTAIKSFFIRKFWLPLSISNYVFR
jgi:hypothetical protein